MKTAVKQCLVVLILLPCTVGAEEVRGKVVGITDGDTLTILDANQAQHRIRIAGIDAPERNQPFGQASRQNLVRLIFKQSIKADCYKWDRGRRICNAFVDTKDVGLEQIRAGMAWHFKRFEREQTSEARRAYDEAENAARSAKLGIWQDGPTAVPPWEWRNRNRKQPAQSGPVR